MCRKNSGNFHIFFQRNLNLICLSSTQPGPIFLLRPPPPARPPTFVSPLSHLAPCGAVVVEWLYLSQKKCSKSRKLTVDRFDWWHQFRPLCDRKIIWFVFLSFPAIFVWWWITITSNKRHDLSFEILDYRSFQAWSWPIQIESNLEEVWYEVCSIWRWSMVAHETHMAIVFIPPIKQFDHYTLRNMYYLQNFNEEKN